MVSICQKSFIIIIIQQQQQQQKKTTHTYTENTLKWLNIRFVSKIKNYFKNKLRFKDNNNNIHDIFFFAIYKYLIKET
jgi:hypothetical protein